MTHSPLDYFLLGQLSAFLLIFCRVGSALLAMPGFGETYVPTRIRLLFGLGLATVLTPVLMTQMPALPDAPFALFALMAGEILIGIFMGLMVRMLLLVVHAAGNIIATQSSLAVASAFDPTSANQSAIVGNLLSIVALTMFFTLNFHHMMIGALYESYATFTPGVFPATADLNAVMVRFMADSFRLGVILSGPHIAYSLLFYLAGGLMSRLMPNFQIFFVMMSLQIVLALLLLVAIVSPMMEIFATFVQNHLGNFVSSGV